MIRQNAIGDYADDLQVVPAVATNGKANYILTCLHTTTFPNGEVRVQLNPVNTGFDPCAGY